LLDVNVLVALLDADHVQHEAARAWLRASVGTGWASCPTTQNGCLRVMSQTAYPNHFPVASIASRLGAATRTQHHVFWPDDVSLLDDTIADTARVHGSRQVTDVYLLALAVAHGGRLVTFDQKRIPLSAVRGAEDRHLASI
jgi:toxin-antitoxin system PIN domain toxin